MVSLNETQNVPQEIIAAEMEIWKALDYTVRLVMRCPSVLIVSQIHLPHALEFLSAFGSIRGLSQPVFLLANVRELLIFLSINNTPYTAVPAVCVGAQLARVMFPHNSLVIDCGGSFGLCLSCPQCASLGLLQYLHAFELGMISAVG